MSSAWDITLQRFELGRLANPSTNPTPQQVREARSHAGLTAQKAAALVYRTQRNWFQWERGERKMCPALFELFCIKVKKNG